MSSFLTPTPSTPTHRRRPAVRAFAASAILLAAVGLAGCGGSDQPSGEPSQAQSASAPAGGPGGFGGGEQFEKIRSCLKAAGIDVPDLPTDRPSGMPTDRPSGMPEGMPTDMPSRRPSGMPSGRAGGGFGGIDMSDTKVQAALKACGIELPSGMPSAPPSN